jgi:hypothetical protein
MYVGFFPLFKITADHLSTQRREKVEEVINTDGSIGTMICTTLMVSLFHFIDLFNLLKTKRNLLYIRSQSVPRSKLFPTRL